jgi:hypothetical protein
MLVSRPRTADEQKTVDDAEANRQTARQAELKKRNRQWLIERRRKLIAEIEEIDRELAADESVTIGQVVKRGLGGGGYRLP